MSTGQMYVGKGNNVPSTEQTASTDAPTAHSGPNSPLSPDERQQHFYNAQTQLLKLVDEFMFEETLSGPIELLNDLLYRWLTCPYIGGEMPDMKNQGNREQLYRAFELVKFLAKAYELHVAIDYNKSKEVSNG